METLKRSIKSNINSLSNIESVAGNTRSNSSRNNTFSNIPRKVNNSGRNIRSDFREKLNPRKKKVLN